MSISIVHEKSSTRPISEPTVDFLIDDVNSLMNTPVNTSADRVDVDAMFSAYDRELMSFKPKAKWRTWPQPIRKR